MFHLQKSKEKKSNKDMQEPLLVEQNSQEDNKSSQNVGSQSKSSISGKASFFSHYAALMRKTFITKKRTRCVRKFFDFFDFNTHISSMNVKFSYNVSLFTHLLLHTLTISSNCTHFTYHTGVVLRAVESDHIRGDVLFDLFGK